MRIYNTLKREKQELKTIKPDEVSIYACGPTVYNYIHIGNARPLCVFDVLRKYLTWRGMKVNFVQNFTDIDDKLIKKANEEGITVKEVAERYIEEFWKDVRGLNISEATYHPKATENIDAIIKLITTLIEKEYAY
ncbi:MAG: class I tRNA ligase family protein, partial [Oscillospiraceae bacterium]